MPFQLGAGHMSSVAVAGGHLHWELLPRTIGVHAVERAYDCSVVAGPAQDGTRPQGNSAGCGDEVLTITCVAAGGVILG